MQPDPTQHRLIWHLHKDRDRARTNDRDPTTRSCEEEGGIVDTSFLYGRTGTWRERPLDGLPPANSILYETGKAVAAALGFGVLLGAVMQCTGLR